MKCTIDINRHLKIGTTVLLAAVALFFSGCTPDGNQNLEGLAFRLMWRDDFDADFNVFAVEWAEDYIDYFVSDVLYRRITPQNVNGQRVFDGPADLLLNVAVGAFTSDPPRASPHSLRKW